MCRCSGAKICRPPNQEMVVGNAPDTKTWQWFNCHVPKRGCSLNADTSSSRAAGGSFRGERTYKPKKEFAYRMHAATSAIPKPNFVVLRRSAWWRSDALWYDVVWCGMMSCGWFRGDVRTGNVVSHEMSCYVMWRDVVSCHLVSCRVMWRDVVSCHVVSCRVMWCDMMQWDGMLFDVMWWELCDVLNDDVLWTTEGRCHSKTCETSIPMRGATLGCKTQEDYGEPMSQNYDSVLQRTTTYYNSLLRYCSVLQSITPYYY